MDQSSSAYGIFLVVPSDQTKDTVSGRLKETYEQLSANEMDPSWIEFGDCLELSKSDNSLFICDPFSGEAYNHLQKLGCRIMGPHCLLTCLKDGSNLPKRPRPVFSLNMRHVVVTFSNISLPNKKKLRDMVLLMGGECPNSLTQSCTHLVTGCVGSEKYVTAVRLKLPIMTPEWVLTCWTEAQKSSNLLQHATENIYDTFKCQPFTGLVVTASQLDSRERQKIQALVTENGGKYFGAMKSRETTHLVLETPSGNKYEHAQSWKVKCVTKDWINDCVAAGSYIVEDSYELRPDDNVRQNKASTPKKGEEFPLPAPNCSMLVPTGTKDFVNETCLSNVSFILAPAKSLHRSKSRDVEVTEQRVSDDETHMELKESLAVNYISAQESTSSFQLANNDVSSKSNQSDRQENKENVKDVTANRKNGTGKSDRESTVEKLESYNSALNEMSEVSKVSIFSEIKFVIVEPNAGDHSLLVEMLESHGGTVVSSTHPQARKCVWIVPVIEIGNSLAPSDVNVRTHFWVQICIEQQSLQPVNTHKLFQPIHIASTDNPPLKGCVLAFSQFSASDKDCLVYLANMLGAECSEYFVRVENKKKGLLPNTHLILASAEGNKYEAALKWGIPAVSKEWLFQAAELNSRPDEKMFLISTPIAEKMVGMQENDSRLDVTNLSSHNVTSNEAVNDKSAERSKAVNVNNSVKEPIDSPKLNDTSWKAGFDVSEALEMLKSRKKRSMSLEEKANYYFSIAQQNFGINSPGPSSSASVSKVSPLVGVVLCVSRKLASQQKKLHSITEKLGGRVLWGYDDSCTHFVHQGKSSDHFGYGVKELRLAQAQSKFVVSPEWLFACEELQSRVSESDFPFNYNPRLSLSGQITSEKINLSQDERKHERSTANVQTKTDLKSPSKPLARNLNSPAKLISPVKPSAHDHKSPARFGTSKTRSANLNDLPAQKKSDIKERTPAENSSQNNDVSKQLQELMTVRKYSLLQNSAQRASPASRAYPIEQVQTVPQLTMEPETQPSQNVPIMWEDPTEKKELERLAQNPVPLPPESEEAEGPQQTDDENYEELMDSPTQKAPKKRIFLLSGLQEENKLKFLNIIEQLGGAVADIYNEQVTHLVCETPTKNEKILSSLAAGIWILHPAFIYASEKASQFMSEEEFEWGSESLKTKMQKLPSKVQKVAVAAHVWRNRIAETGKKAFHGWEVKLFVAQQRVSAYTCILKAGGARVVNAYTPGFSAKYAFLEGHFDVDLSELESQGAICAKPEYFSAILVENPVPSASLFAVKDIHDRHNSTGNKRRTNTAEPDSKKNRST